MQMKEKKKHRDPTVYPNVPPLTTLSAPIGRSFERQLALLVRHLALDSNAELHEEAADKNKR